jgi:hypothetical protein
MTEAEQTTCLTCTLLRRLRRQQLPKVFAIKARLDLGERVSTDDIRYLLDSVADAMRAKQVFDRSPDLAQVSAKLIALYRDITVEALQNEAGLHA